MKPQSSIATRPFVVDASDVASPRPTFGERLRALLLERNLSAAELARLIQARVPRFGAGNVSHYLCERSFPRPPILNAISEILQTDLSDFANEPHKRRSANRPSASATDAPPEDSQGSMLHLTDAGDGDALLQFNQKVPWPLALKILQAIRGADEAAETRSDDPKRSSSPDV